jgi:hypothetical protein
MGLFRKILDSIAGSAAEPAVSTKARTSQRHLKTTPARPSSHGESGLTPARQSAAPAKAPAPSILFSQLGDPSVQHPTPVLDELIDGLDQAFDNACSSASTANSHRDLPANEAASIHELFCQIAAAYAIPLKNFIFELQRHTATKNTIEFCQPILHSIRRAAETINLPETVERMNEFDAALTLGQASSDRFLKGEVRQQILDAYDALAAVLPAAFQIGEESRQREDIIIHSLFQEIPRVGCVTFEKIFRSGLGSLDMLFLANPEDLAAATGIQRKLCEKICHRIQQYRQEAELRASQPGQAGYRSRLVELVNELRELVNGEKAAAVSRSGTQTVTEKRTQRQQRNTCFLEVNVTLAELGALDLFHQLQKIPFRKRLQLLDSYLASSEAVNV